MKPATRTWFSCVAAAAISALLTAGQAGAATVFNTGVSASNVPLAVGSADPHWTVISGPGVTTPFSAIVSTTISAYVDPTDSAWIWTNAAGSSGRNNPYTFRTTFTLSAAEASSITLSGAWAVDNFGSITLNGANPVGSGTFALAGSVIQNFNQLYAFSITGGFVAGDNTLDFSATDTGGAAGLLVSRLTVSPIPEASTLSMFAVGAACALLLSRRRIRQYAA